MNRAPTGQPALPGPQDILRTVLPNGIVLLHRFNPNSPSVFLTGHIHAGSLFDSEDKLGLAGFTAMSLMRGTQKRDFQAIFDALESCGAGLSFGGGVHVTSFSGRALVEDFRLLVTLLAEAVRYPTFPAGQVEKLRAQILTHLDIRAHDTAEMAALAFDQILFAGHPYRHPEDGWPETIRGIRVEDLVDFHRHCYGPRGMLLAVVGAVEKERVVAEVEKALGDWHNPEQRKAQDMPPYRPLRKTRTRRVRIAGKSQSDLVVGTHGPRRRDPDYIAASLSNSIFGEFGLMGRIGESLREKAGLAYYAGSSLSAGVGPGTWRVSAGVNPMNVENACQLVQDEILRLIRSGVSREELEDSQANYVGRLPLALEHNAGVAGALVSMERYELGLDYLQRYPDLVRAVTPEMILEVSRRYWHADRLAIAVAGPGER